MKKQFQELHDFLIKLNESNSSNDKVDTIYLYANSNPFIKKILFYTYNPYYQFFVTSKNIEKVRGKRLTNAALCTDIFELLDLLRTRRKTGHDAIASIEYFIKTIESPDYDARELMYLIIDKDFKVRAGATLINKAVPDLVPQFKIALATKFEECVDTVDFDKEEWYSSHKLDGIRCVTIIDDHGNPTFWSREGNEFSMLRNLVPEIKLLNLKNKVLDGELCIMNGEVEDFKAISGEIKMKDHTILNPRYYLFDYLSLDDFNKRQSNTKLSNRLDNLEDLLSGVSLKALKILEQTLIKSQKQLEDTYAECNKKGWEGLILRKNTYYEGKRSKNMLKLKKFDDAEFIVESVENGMIQFIDPKTGRNAEEEMLAKVFIRYKGHVVKVGSGFTLAERQHYYKHPGEIIGKQIKVQYQGESTNQEGGISLRIPTLQHIFLQRRDF